MKKKIIATVIVLSFIISLFSGISVFAAESDTIVPDIRNFETNVGSDEVQVISLDVTIPEGATSGYTVKFIDASTSEWNPYGYIRLKKDGTVAAGSGAENTGLGDGAWLDTGTYDKKGVSFPVGEPFILTARLNRVTGNVDFYIDGAWCFSQRYKSSDLTAQPETPINPWYVIKIGTNTANPIASVTLKYSIGLEAEELGAKITTDESKKTIDVNFTENIVNANFAGTKLICVSDGTEVPISVKSSSNSAATFTYKEDLVSPNEYALVLPNNITGEKYGYELSSRYSYFSVNSAHITVDNTETFDNSYDATKNLIVKEQGGDVVSSVTTGNTGKSGKGLLVNSGTKQNATSNLYWQKFPDAIKTADIQTIEFDIKPLRSDLEAATRFTDGSSNKPLVMGFSNGKLLAGYGWESGAEVKAGAYNVDKWYNVQLQWDSVKKTGSIKIASDSESESVVQTFTAESLGKLTSFLTVVYKDTMGIKTSNNTDLFILDNVRFMGANNLVSVDKVRFKDMDGKSVGACESVSRLLDSVNVYFSNEVDGSSVDTTTVKLSYDGEPVDYTVKYDEASKCATLTPTKLPAANASVKVEISGVKDINAKDVLPYTCAITTESTQDEVRVQELSFVSADGTAVETLDSGNVYLKAVVANTTDSDKEVVISAMGYSNSALSGFDYQVVTVPAGTVYKTDGMVIDPITLDVTNADSVRATIQSKVDNNPFAEGVYLEKTAASDGKLNISGSVTDAAKDTDVVIEVYAPDKTFDDLASAEDFRDVLIYKTQVKTAEDGSYTAAFNVDYANAKSGMYTVITAAKDYKNESDILYTNPAETTTVLKDNLNPAIASGNIDAIGEVIYTNHYDLYVDDEYITEALADKAAAIIVEFAKENTLTEDNVKTVVNKAVAIAGLNAGVITDIIGESEIFDLDNSAIKDVYEADYVTETTRANLVTRMYEEKCASIDVFDTTLTEEFVLSVVANPVRPGSVEAVLKLVGLTGYSSDAYTGVSNKVFSSITELKNALSVYKPSSGTSSTPGGGTGGNSGSAGKYQVANGGGGSAPVSGGTTETTKPIVTEIFSDLGGYEWAKDSITKLYEDGIVSGTGTGTFEPGRTVNREEFVKMLCEAFGYGTGGTVTGFDDVAESAWYAPYISRAVELGMVNGVSESTFGSGTQISREDMAVIIYRALLAADKEIDANGTQFADAAEIADYAKQAVDMLAGAEIVNGVGDGRFAPKASASRAEAAVIILRCIEKFSL